MLGLLAMDDGISLHDVEPVLLSSLTSSDSGVEGAHKLTTQV